MLEDEVAVEQDGLDLGEEAIVAVEVGPASLDHPDLRLGEVVDDAEEPVARRDKSASKMATNSPLATLRPSWSAPALKPLRLVRWR